MWCQTITAFIGKWFVFLIKVLKLITSFGIFDMCGSHCLTINGVFHFLTPLHPSIFLDLVTGWKFSILDSTMKQSHKPLTRVIANAI